MASHFDPVAKDKAREELRALRRAARNEYPGYLLLSCIKEFSQSHRDRPATDKDTRRYKADLLRIARTNLCGFNFLEKRYRLLDTNAAANITSFYYWHPMQAQVTALSNESDRRMEDFLILRHAKLAVDRKRTIYDEYDGGIIINQHALMRMLERGAAIDFPLTVLNQQFDLWYPLAVALLVCQAIRQEDGFHGFLPIPGGAFLTRTSFTEHCVDNKGNNISRRRALTNRGTFQFDNAPLEPFIDAELNGNKGMPIIQLTTYISRLQMSSDQWWVYTRLSNLRDEFKELLPMYPSLIHSSQLIPPLEEINHLLDAFHKQIINIFNSPQWRRATRLV